MDLRDPWSEVPRVPEHIGSPVWWAIAGRHERRTIAQAALVVANTPALAASLARRYPRAKVISVLNGWDDEPMPPARHDGRFTIGYAGAIYLDRDPTAVFRAAARVVRELGLSPAQLGIELMGHVMTYGDRTVTSIAEAEGLPGFIRVYPPGPRRAALEFFARCALLVSLPQDSDMQIPSKVYEYLRSPAWVLALATPESATGMVLQGTGADLVRPGDVDGIARVIRAHYEAFAAGARPVPLAADERLSRRFQARILMDAIAALS